MMELRMHKIRGILAIILHRIFLLPNSYQKNLKIKIYRTVILPVLLYKCEASSLTLRKKYISSVFENSVLRRIFGPESDVGGSWRKLRNDEFRNTHSSLKIVRLSKSRRIMGWDM
jgi:hypothetical protein